MKESRYPHRDGSKNISVSKDSEKDILGTGEGGEVERGVRAENFGDETFAYKEDGESC
jgi:hypothetical protein